MKLAFNLKKVCPSEKGGLRSDHGLWSLYGAKASPQGGPGTHF
ncbi:MAG: hypothetical protein U5L00_08690 [Desulfovermiculus sp.]|nr:hypothetical protein [Desulfovermiculus sp.]